MRKSLPIYSIYLPFNYLKNPCRFESRCQWFLHFLLCPSLCVSCDGFQYRNSTIQLKPAYCSKQRVYTALLLAPIISFNSTHCRKLNNFTDKQSLAGICYLVPVIIFVVLKPGDFAQEKNEVFGFLSCCSLVDQGLIALVMVQNCCFPFTHSSCQFAYWQLSSPPSL